MQRLARRLDRLCRIVAALKALYRCQSHKELAAAKERLRVACMEVVE